MNIGILWKDGVSEGWTDVFAISDFEKNCENRLYIHPVVLRGEQTLFAACIKTVNENHVSLDYRPFPITNEREEILSGIIEFTINIEKHIISKLTWYDEQRREIEKVLFQQTAPLKRPRVPKRIFDLLACEDIDSESPFYDKVKEAFSQAPKKININTKAFIRNPIVVKEALKRANGICQACKNRAPFVSKVTNEPYLEVHHIDPLSEGGSDNIGNVIAICPNCHREAHYGNA